MNSLWDPSFLMINFGYIVPYLLGVFPTGILISKIRNQDITKLGSGNVGATNVARNFGVVYGLITLFIDVLKGALAVIIGTKTLNLDPYTTGVFVTLGHIVSLPFILKGGKGVATFIGTLIVLNHYALVIFLISFILVFIFFRYVSLSSLVAVWLSVSFIGNLHYILLAMIITLAHQKNIIRLIKKEESKFYFKR